MLATTGVTNGGRAMTSGGRRVWRIAVALIAGLAAVETIVNVESLVDEARRIGRATPAWHFWTWEASSAVAWFAVMPLIALAALRLRPPRLGWPATVAVHLALTLPVSLAHVGLMAAIRHAVHGMMGGWYRLGDDLGAALLYEWRKDALDYVTLALAFALVDWIARRADPDIAPAAPPAVEPSRIAVRDGARTHFVDPGELLWAQAAGNYVELHLASGPLLHRATLAQLEAELGGHGFVRVHRSRIVRRSAVRAVESNASGDFELLIEGGTRIAGSRRYRAMLMNIA
jgi:DNA-binding LytR/AlgR family response regulator